MAARWIEHKRHYRQYKARIAALPEPYRAAVAAFERYINHFGGLGDADSILAMLDDVADVFEQAAAEGTPVNEIFGEDPVTFADAFLRNYPQAKWITREQHRLTSAIQGASLSS